MTKKEALLGLMMDLRWHTSAEMAEVAGQRFSATLHQLKLDGYHFESQEKGLLQRMLSATPGTPMMPKVRLDVERRDAEALLLGVVPEEVKRLVREAMGGDQ